MSQFDELPYWDWRFESSHLQIFIYNQLYQKDKNNEKDVHFKQNILIQSIHDQKRSLVERLKRRNIIYCFQGSW